MSDQPRAWARTSPQRFPRPESWSPTDRIRELTVELLASLHVIRDGAWRDEVDDDGTVICGATDEVEMAQALLAAGDHLDRSRWALEDLVNRDHLELLVAELHGRAQ